MFTRTVTVRLHHTDAYGIIFFANQFKLCHDVFQDWLEEQGLPLPVTRTAVEALAVVIRAESDYAAPIQLGDRLTIAYGVEKIGSTSFVNAFTLTNQAGVLVGKVRTVHVMTDPVTSAKRPLPPAWRTALTGSLVPGL